MVIHLDGLSISIETMDRQMDKFVWKDLGEFNLEKGRHKIILENIDGFNAVNLFALVTEENYQKAREETKKVLENKNVVYILEAESDFYRQKESLLGVEDNLEASNGRMVKLGKNGTVWQRLEIVKEGNYKVGLKGKGKFEVRIGEKNFKIKSDNLESFVYTPSFSLAQGKHSVEIRSLVKNSKLDVVWVYSTEKDEDLTHIFSSQEIPAQVLDYKKVNSTLWKAHIKNSDPFMLSFAESYDSSWEGEIYKNGELIKKVKPVPLYSVINGFWIEETGDLEIKIRYKPQDWFKIGLIVSGLTLIGCISYSIYDLRRNKEI